MTFKHLIISSVVAGFVATAAHAKVGELNQAEVRASVQTGQSLPLTEILKKVESRVEGNLVDVRAFDLDGIYYQVMMKLPDGRLAFVVLDGKTGEFVRQNSRKMREVRAAVDGTNGKSNRGRGNGRYDNRGRDVAGNANSGGGSSNAGGGGGGNGGGGGGKK
ncbi:MAG: hypothetical protein HKO95_13170 [Rhodobacteraceae bacterium]|nr:hypothetical protein [Alphaproteobacteria bacterium]NNK67674.1 hypothetical protein [Paracoccaceae bacterium]